MTRKAEYRIVLAFVWIGGTTYAAMRLAAILSTVTGAF